QAGPIISQNSLSLPLQSISLTVAGAFQQHEAELNLYCRLCLSGLRCAKLLSRDSGASEFNGGSVYYTGANWERQLTKPLDRIASYKSLLEALLRCAPAGGDEQRSLI
uniref:DH domain-containing protein n=1 Tax=Macrostomum lignano TaxID=282301 RepID=A0A1I8GW70_9PLAT